jgi:hypothetical protein
VAKDLVYIDAHGDKQALDLSLATVKEAADQGFSLKQFLNSRFPTDADRHGTAYEQALEQCNIFVRGNREMGIRASNFDDILNPSKEANSPITRDGVPASRILFPAVILDVIEDKLQVDRDTTPNALGQMIAIEESIQGNRWERPVLNFSKPEAARSAPVSQLSLPNVMLSITASDKSMAIPSWSLGMEISEQALRSTSLDLVGLALGRQASVERNERANGYILKLLQGDTDLGMVALSSISGKVVTAQSLDAGITTAGTLSQTAWLKWLSANSTKRRITHIVTALATAMAIENRSGKPTVQNDNPNSPRMDTLFSVINPTWPANVQIFLTEDPNWPANTIMGFDRSYGIHKVNSLSAQYSAVEQFALKRSTAMRFDNGELLYRLFDEAFEVLTLTVA